MSFWMSLLPSFSSRKACTKIGTSKHILTK
jgi:hypothetical protein